jgi:hypothetical protein
MKRFEANRANKQMLSISGFKHPVPFVSFSPIKEDKKTSVFLFTGGLGGTLPFVEMMNYPFFDSHYLVSYEKASHGNNLNKPKRFPNFFINELDKIIDKVRELFPNKRIYLLGES